eukprot:CAMPEP_0113541190 /NCGR_PEP_ID=MMETSP0015_2-20120614/8895_1 /TAXON_ID=2838 /ORGANISM="Odontella" /LENGTH=580 /DNA_ID=CAMNT_0000441071 /DNA_START=217 /DNA_END=1959 /DNA_ORIENTATION=+ /assembly_acc=CAM_ASM_000160
MSDENGNNNNNNNEKGVAGRTDYSTWEKKASSLVKDLDAEDESDRTAASEALGHGRHASSQAEADERKKAEEVKKAKEALEGYKRREERVVQSLSDLLSGAPEHKDSSSGKSVRTRYITRDVVEAFRRVVSLSDTAGPGRIVLTQDLDNLVSAVPINQTLTPKSYEGDAENAVEEEKMNEPRTRNVHGIIKLNLTNLKDCDVVVRCKIITRSIEIANCENVTLRIEKEATAATVQADLCQNIRVEYHDTPSGKDPGIPNRPTSVFWGEDANDRIYHAGVSDLSVATYRDGYLDLECTADYKKLGAEAAGNATAEETQFVTSVVDGELITEKVLRTGGSATSGGTARPMTEREVEAEKRKKEEKMKAFEGMIQFKEKAKLGQGEQGTEEKRAKPVPAASAETKEDVQEVYAGATQDEIDAIVRDCEAHKAKGNEAFVAGEYAQAVLLYSLALDKAAELPEEDDAKAAIAAAGEKIATAKPTLNQLFPRHVVLSNRSASFLKLGEHAKALADAEKATALDPTYVKGVFRRGMALHAMGRYTEAAPILGQAHKMEPKNKQIKQALQFAEMRLQREMRARMEGT